MKKIYLLILFIDIIFVTKGQQTKEYFDNVDRFLKKHVSNGLVDYDAIVKNEAELKTIVVSIANFEVNKLNPIERKAFFINAYNILVIDNVANNFPVQSPKNVAGFFDYKKHKIAGRQMTLNQIENQELREKTKDPRLHFVLVCAALGCPKIIEEAYRPLTLEAQLDKQTELSLNDTYFIRVKDNDKMVLLSEIFKWYEDDFLLEYKSVTDFLNHYRKNKISTNYKTGYYNYDWTLNVKKEVTSDHTDVTDADGNSISNIVAFTPSVLLKKGQIEIKNFNNIYTQTSFDLEGETQELDERQTFYTGIFQFSYGVSQTAKVNVGLDVYLNHVTYKPINGLSGESFNRTAIGAIGPRVKISPFNSLPTFSVQSSLLFPVANDLESPRFLAHDRLTWWTQFFYDKTFDNFQLFVEADVLFRFRKNETFLRTPVSLFLSYFPSQKITFYGTIQHSPKFQRLPEGSDTNFARTAWFNQAGVGVKYQISPQLNIEALVTDFFSSRNDGLGKTYNVGFRFIK